MKPFTLMTNYDDSPVWTQHLCCAASPSGLWWQWSRWDPACTVGLLLKLLTLHFDYQKIVFCWAVVHSAL